jgi:hypothetical protein
VKRLVDAANRICGPRFNCSPTALPVRIDPLPGTISNTNILCGFRILRRSLVGCVRGISSWPFHQGTKSDTARIHFIFNTLDSFAADFIRAGFSYLRQITECAADLVPIKSSLWQKSSLHCSLGATVRCPGFRFSGIGRGRNYDLIRDVLRARMY